ERAGPDRGVAEFLARDVVRATRAEIEDVVEERDVPEERLGIRPAVPMEAVRVVDVVVDLDGRLQWVFDRRVVTVEADARQDEEIREDTPAVLGEAARGERRLSCAVDDLRVADRGAGEAETRCFPVLV